MCVPAVVQLLLVLLVGRVDWARHIRFPSTRRRQSQCRHILLCIGNYCAFFVMHPGCGCPAHGRQGRRGYFLPDT